MATVFNMDNYNEFKVTGGKVDPGMYNAKKKTVFDEYTLAAELVVGDTFLLPALPEGALIIEAGIYIDTTLGTSGIFDMGLEAYVNKDGDDVVADPNSLIQQADGGGQAVNDRSGIGAVAIGKTIGKGGAQPVLIVTEVSTAGDGVKIQAWVDYIIA